MVFCTKATEMTLARKRQEHQLAGQLSRQQQERQQQERQLAGQQPTRWNKNKNAAQITSTPHLSTINQPNHISKHIYRESEIYREILPLIVVQSRNCNKMIIQS